MSKVSVEVIKLKIFTKLIHSFYTISLISFTAFFIFIFYLGAPTLTKGQYLKVYDKSHNLIYQSHHQSDDVLLEDIAPYFVDSIIAIEDKRFYNHFGIDIKSIIRAITNNITNSSTQGASTITQQYARLLYLNNEKTITRKLKEAILALRIEAFYDKDTILQGYLNTVYFGHGIYGIKDAALYYFNKKPAELDYNESSMLAGVINAPSHYSPFIDIEAAKKRQRVVLKRLVDQNIISREIADDISHTPLNLNKTKTKLINNTPYFKDHVIKELKALGFDEEKYLSQGLNIETTLDSNIQITLNNIVDENMKDKEELEVAGLILDSKTGGVLAMVGGKNYETSQFNRATSASRQVASTIKPLLYYTAIENGFTPTTKFKSEKTSFMLENGESYSPSNFNDLYANEDIILAKAIALSDNIYAVKTHLFLGEQALVNKLNLFGYKNITPHPSLALGTLNTNIYDFSNIYTTLANSGVYNPTHSITRITTKNNVVLYKHINKDEQLLDKNTTHILNQLLTSPFQEAFVSHASPTMQGYKTNATFATKTGTSPYDSLCVGYNPNYTILSWVGYDDNRELTSSTDKRVPKIIFQKMANYLQEEDIWYDSSSLSRIPINPHTGEYSESGIIYWFK